MEHTSHTLGPIIIIDVLLQDKKREILQTDYSFATRFTTLTLFSFSLVTWFSSPLVCMEGLLLETANFG